jgi:hypothetical protein
LGKGFGNGAGIGNGGICGFFNSSGVTRLVTNSFAFFILGSGTKYRPVNNIK